MRAVVQRVTSASVAVDSEVVSSIGRGLMVLVGVGTDDNASDVETLSNKILNLRVFSDDSGSMWKRSVKDIQGDILCVSQFTLLANTTKGNKPDFHRAMASEASRHLYSSFLDRIGSLYDSAKIKDGRFGAMMNVSLTNEGPVTFTLDSRKFEYVDQPVSAPSVAKPAKAARAEKWRKVTEEKNSKEAIVDSVETSQENTS
ncbi:D-Tyr tRNAtyr deacylase-like domain-containing protein [Abortiporus biennis]|nr:D-Tyr tRNAtyr deacylase-like domain-containing protein [Abortiporus biennis]